jgi:hypothetical protein
MYRAVLRFADAPDAARGLQLFALLQGERWDEATKLADSCEAFASEFPHVQLHRARAFQHAGRGADAKRALDAAKEGGVDVELQFGHPVLAPLLELEGRTRKAKRPPRKR